MSVGSPYGEPHRKDPQVVREREEALIAPRALLLRRAELIRVRAEHAAVTLPRPEHGPAARTCVEVLTGVLGHRLAPRRSAFRTRDRRLGDGHRASGIGHRAKLARVVPKRRRGARGAEGCDRDPHFAPHGYGSSSLPPRKQHCGTGFMSPASAGVTSPLTRRVTGEHTGQAARLALQLELCLPRLLSSPAPEGSFDGLRAFSRNPGRRARPTSLLPFPLQRAEPSIRRSRGPIMAQPMSDATRAPTPPVSTTPPPSDRSAPAARRNPRTPPT